MKNYFESLVFSVFILFTVVLASPCSNDYRSGKGESGKSGKGRSRGLRRLSKGSNGVASKGSNGVGCDTVTPSSIPDGISNDCYEFLDPSLCNGRKRRRYLLDQHDEKDDTPMLVDTKYRRHLNGRK
mmetsp:Transcript_48121/g.58028  ORF Transcript_48121/g.58028 Transcript_48121/m.58028 type:complete len:127 (-) Transcript_48121:111-491(-)